MGLLRYNFRSEVLGMYTDITITYPSGLYTYYPPNPDEESEAVFKRAARQLVPGQKFQTVYVLHGGGEDDSLLHRYTRLELYAERNNVMTVAPQVNDGFFIDTRYGYDYFTYITEELPVIVRSLFASSAKREDNFVLGMAMGGNGALTLAMKRPDLYAACADLSGGIGCSIDTQNTVEQLHTIKMRKMQNAFEPADAFPGSAFDLGAMAQKHVEVKTALPQLFIGVGQDDFICHVVRRDKEALEKLGIPVHYEEVPGYAHEWDFWDKYMGKALDEWLPLKR